MFLQEFIKKFVLLLLLPGFYAANAQEASVKAKGYYTSDFVIDGIPRNITFYIPRGYGKNDTYPLVFVLHAEGENGKTVIKKYGDDLERLADSSGVIVIYPDAVKGRWAARIGNTRSSDSINDVGFANIMLDYFVQQYKADEKRIFVMGFYNGGDMAWRLGCEVPKKITAIAPFIPSAAAAQKSCVPAIPIFNTEQYTKQPVNKFSYGALSAAWNFLLSLGK